MVKHSWPRCLSTGVGICTGYILALAVMANLSPAQSDEPDIVRAQRIEITDSIGIPRAALWIPKNGLLQIDLMPQIGPPILVVNGVSRDDATLVLRAEDSASRCRLSVGALTEIALSGRGPFKASMGIGPKGPAVLMSDGKRVNGITCDGPNARPERP